MFKMHKTLVALLLTILTIQISFAQAPKRANSADIYDAIKKLNVLGSATSKGVESQQPLRLGDNAVSRETEVNQLEER